MVCSPAGIEPLQWERELKQKKKAVIYVRVSTKEQTKNTSLETQQGECEAFCLRRGWEIVRVFVEEGESAKTVDRTNFQKLIDYCRSRKGEITFVVVYAVSRFSRDVGDHASVGGILASCGTRLRSVTESIDETAVGKMLENVLSTMAQFDNDVRSERTVAGMQAKLEKGIWTHRPPLGYTKKPTTDRSCSMVHDLQKAPLVRKAFVTSEFQ